MVELTRVVMAGLGLYDLPPGTRCCPQPEQISTQTRGGTRTDARGSCQAPANRYNLPINALGGPR